MGAPKGYRQGERAKKIRALLLIRPRTVAELADEMQLGKVTVYKHLKRMEARRMAVTHSVVIEPGTPDVWEAVRQPPVLYAYRQPRI